MNEFGGCVVNRVFAAVILGALTACSSNSSTPTPLPTGTMESATTALRQDLTQYLKARGSIEHISAASLSVSLPDGRWIDLAAGTMSYHGGIAVTTRNLFQIASNTKAFTAIIALRLAAAGKLNLDQTIGQWLPQYPQWKSITIRRLLNMTSGIASFDASNAWQKAIVADPKHDFTPEQLIAYVENIPLQKGYLYSDTNYALTQLVLEKASGRSYTDLVRNLIGEAALQNAYYYPDVYPKVLRDRTVAGYFYNHDQRALAPLLGENVRDFSLSWGQAGGGIVADPHSLVKWTRAMYQGTLITSPQRRELESLVSTKTGKPISRTGPNDPAGFGLGVGQFYSPQYGVFWAYEGQTLGYRVQHVFFPSKNLLFSIGLNSTPDADHDHIAALVAAVYQTLKTYGLI